MPEHTSTLKAFLYAVSHDFGRPLRQIGAFTELLEDKHAADFDDETSQWLDYINQATREAQQMLARLLVYSRMARHDVSRRHQQIAPVVDAGVAELSVRHPRRNSDVSLTGDAIACVDGELLQLALCELLDNALSYSLPGPVKVEIDMVDQLLRCRVCDVGRGIDPEQEQAAMRPFGRLQPQDAEHVGLGLNIAARAAEVMGGELALARGTGGFTAELALPV